MKNTIQDYAWGSYTAIAYLLGNQSPSIKPQAELWLGAHPKAPSLVKYGGKWVSLLDLIKQYPTDILGKDIAVKKRGVFMEENKKKGFFARLLEKLDKKIEEAANNSPCCCKKEKEDKPCCGK